MHLRNKHGEKIVRPLKKQSILNIIHSFLIVSSDQHRFAHEITDCFSLSTLVFQTNEVF